VLDQIKRQPVLLKARTDALEANVGRRDIERDGRARQYEDAHESSPAA
jgi:hypothetical protein